VWTHSRAIRRRHKAHTRTGANTVEVVRELRLRVYMLDQRVTADARRLVEETRGPVAISQLTSEMMSDITDTVRCVPELYAHPNRCPYVWITLSSKMHGMYVCALDRGHARRCRYIEYSSTTLGTATVPKYSGDHRLYALNYEAMTLDTQCRKLPIASRS
jgi:hypothetical protein